MRLDVHGLHTSLFPTQITFCDAPSQTLPERYMEVWRDDGDIWHYKTELFGKSYEAKFDPDLDAQTIFALADLRENQLDAPLTLKKWVTRPYLGLNLRQQEEMVRGAAALNIFREDKSDTNQRAACRAILYAENAPDDASDDSLDDIKNLRAFVEHDAILAWKNSEEGQAIFNGVTPNDMLGFMDCVLTAALNCLQAIAVPVIERSHMERFYNLLLPTEVVWCDVFLPDAWQHVHERQMIVWKVGHAWHLKTKHFNREYECTFNARVDTEIISRLDKIRQKIQAQDVFQKDITEAFYTQRRDLVRPYMRLTSAQQGTQKDILLLSGLFDHFSTNPENRETDIATCLSLLGLPNTAELDSGVVQGIKGYLTDQALNFTREAQGFLDTRANTTTDEIKQFVYFLLGAMLVDLGHPIAAITMPEPPAEPYHPYWEQYNRDEHEQEREPFSPGLPRTPSYRPFSSQYAHRHSPDIRASRSRPWSAPASSMHMNPVSPQYPRHDMPPEADIDMQDDSPYENFEPEPEPEEAPAEVQESELGAEDQKTMADFEVLLQAVKSVIPHYEYDHHFSHLRDAVRAWLQSDRGLDALRAFRIQGDAFTDHGITKKYHVTPSFFGGKSYALRELEQGLQGLRDHAFIRKAQLKMIDRTEESSGVAAFISCLIQLCQSIASLSLYPMMLWVSAILPIALTVIHSLAVAEVCFRMTIGAEREYIEAARELWPALGALLLAATMGGAWLGLFVGSFVLAPEVLILSATYAAVALLTTTATFLTAGLLGFVSGRVFDALWASKPESESTLELPDIPETETKTKAADYSERTCAFG